MARTYVKLKYLETAPGPLRVSINLQVGGAVTLSRGQEIATWLDDRDRESLSGKVPPWYEITETAVPESDLGVARPEAEHAARAAAKAAKTAKKAKE